MLHSRHFVSAIERRKIATNRQTDRMLSRKMLLSFFLVSVLSFNLVSTRIAGSAEENELVNLYISFKNH